MTTVNRFAEAVWNVLCEAVDLYRDDSRTVGRLRRQLDRLEEPLRVAVVGPWRSGKSTLLNAILGEEVAPIGVPDDAPILTWYQDGPEPRAIAYSSAGPPQELPISRSGAGLRVDLVGWRADGVDDILVQWPTRALRQMTLIDTPAVTGAGDDANATVTSRIRQDADAVLCLTRDGRGSDLRILESLGRGAPGQTTPVHVILVLSRADEVSGGRIDALVTAKQLARRHRRNPMVNALSVGVVAVSGLVGLAGRGLSESDFAVLAVLSRVPRSELDPYLLSADRFIGGALPVFLDTGVRRELLDRFGLFGVRLAVTLIRAGHDSRGKLSAELARRSGLVELREAMARSFISRREVLKANAALNALADLLRAEQRPVAVKLLSRVEQILANAHELHELRLLAALQDSHVRFTAELTREAYQLIGGGGIDVGSRLGADDDATATQLMDLAIDALRRWQQQAEAPLLPLAQRRAARTVVRSCEGMLAELGERIRQPGW